jgi:hypothetical protein
MKMVMIFCLFLRLIHSPVNAKVSEKRTVSIFKAEARQPMNFHGAKTQKNTVILTIVKTSNLADRPAAFFVTHVTKRTVL